MYNQSELTNGDLDLDLESILVAGDELSQSG